MTSEGQENIRDNASKPTPPSTDSWATAIKDKPAGPAGHVKPEFGKASPLRGKLLSVFNIPKKGAPRPEHHRSNPPSRSTSGSATAPSAVYEIPPPIPKFDALYGPPKNAYVQKPGLPPVFSSAGSALFMPIHVPATAAPRVVDSTRDHDSDDEFDPDAALKSRFFGEPSPFEYIDPQKANENLKQLLEGAIDDDEDEEAGKKRRLPRQLKKVGEIAAKASDGAKSLAEKLKLLEVKEDKDLDKPKDEKVEEAEDDEDEGVVEGLNVKLLPHQVDGVAWMIERESGAKKRGVLPKGGILADDVSHLHIYL
jgi:hypothetical protein